MAGPAAGRDSFHLMPPGFAMAAELCIIRENQVKGNPKKLRPGRANCARTAQSKQEKESLMCGIVGFVGARENAAERRKSND